MVRSLVSNARWAGRAAVLVAAMAAAVWLVMLVAMSEEADARSRYKTVTKLFGGSLTSEGIPIPAGQPTTTTGAAAPYPSTATVSGLRRGKILDVNVWMLQFWHTRPDDVDVLLVGPRGQNLIIMSDAGGSSDVSGPDLIFDDEAAGFMGDDFLDSGTNRPSDWDTDNVVDTFPAPAPAPSQAFTLSTFDRTNPNGTWSLYINDDTSGEYGELDNVSWVLEIKARVRR